MGKVEKGCDCRILHEDIVKMFKRGFNQNPLLLKLADFFHILSDNTRISILSVLDQNEICVSDLSSILNMTKSAVSHQLRILKDAGFVKCEKRGKEIFYSYASEDVRGIFEIALNHISKDL